MGKLMQRWADPLGALRDEAQAPGWKLPEQESLIVDARAHVVTTANATLTLLYWRIGQRIRTEVLSGERAAYEDMFACLQRDDRSGLGVWASSIWHRHRPCGSSPAARVQRDLACARCSEIAFSRSVSSSQGSRQIDLSAARCFSALATSPTIR